MRDPLSELCKERRIHVLIDISLLFMGAYGKAAAAAASQMGTERQGDWLRGCVMGWLGYVRGDREREGVREGGKRQPTE